MAVARVPQIEGEVREIVFSLSQAIEGLAQPQAGSIAVDGQPRFLAEDPRQMEG